MLKWKGITWTKVCLWRLLEQNFPYISDEGVLELPIFLDHLDQIENPQMKNSLQIQDRFENNTEKERINSKRYTTAALDSKKDEYCPSDVMSNEAKEDSKYRINMRLNESTPFSSQNNRVISTTHEIFPDTIEISSPNIQNQGISTNNISNPIKFQSTRKSEMSGAYHNRKKSANNISSKFNKNEARLGTTESINSIRLSWYSTTNTNEKILLFKSRIKNNTL